MNESVGLHVHPDMDSCDLKSPSSQESGLGTLLVIDESLGSLEELSEGVNKQLNTHIDQSRLLQYEIELLRAQLAEKNKLISSQQITIIQLQEALNASQREINEIRHPAETELTCKNEMIRILQSDLAECQQQYAECFQQVVDQDRMLAEQRDDNSILLKKVKFLETQLRKSGRDMGTQTPSSYGNSFGNNSSFNKRPNFSTCLPKPPINVIRRPEAQKPDRNYRRSVQSMIDLQDINVNYASPTPSVQSPQDRRYEARKTSVAEDKSPWINQFQDLVTEIRELQQDLKYSTPRKSETPRECHHHCSNVATNTSGFTELWNSITEEKQHRLQLDHNVRLMEIELTEIRNQIQNCSARINQQKILCCPPSRCCNAAASCCPCPNLTASSLYTLV